MPINYSQGIIKEHLHTRKSVSVFDISHMGQILIPSSEDNCKELENFIETKVSSISTSPERNDTILIEDPFNF